MIETFNSAADAQDALRSDQLCRQIGATLKKHYPKRSWYVDVSVRSGVATIMSPSISMRHGFEILVHNRVYEDIERDVVRAAGQILEMFKLSRERGASGGEELLQRGATGEVIQAATGL